MTDAGIPLIAVIEDDEKIIETLTQIFTHRGYSVCPYAGGKPAIADLPTHSPVPSVIVLDLLMPEIDGFDVLRTLRGALQLTIPIIVLTNLSQDSDRERAMGLGADAFLVKSMCSADEIVTTVSSFVGKSHQYKN
jgi:CheY-like chemotaxis protein